MLQQLVELAKPLSQGIHEKHYNSLVWWCRPVKSALRRQKQEIKSSRSFWAIY